MTGTFQDLIGGNHCWGCGPHNEHGLRIKSYWDGDETVCTWTPAPYHAAGPEHVLNGGIIATLIDCHSICSAIADAYRQEGRPITPDRSIWYVTAALDIDYLRPTPLEGPVELRARIVERKGKKSTVECTLSAGGTERARADVVAIRVPPEWREPSAGTPGNP